MAGTGIREAVYKELILGTSLGEIVDQFLMAANWYPLKEKNAECDDVWSMYKKNFTLKQIAEAIIKNRELGKY